MTLRWIEWFLVITILVFLCNCATTNPDSSDDPSAHIDPHPDEESKDDTLLPKEGEQSTSAKNTGGGQSLAIATTPPTDNPAKGGGQDSPDSAKEKNSSSLETASSLEGKSDPASPVGDQSVSATLASGEKPNGNNPTAVAIAEPKSSRAIPVVESPLDLGKTSGTELSDVPLSESLENLHTKDTPNASVLPKDNRENTQPNSGSPSISELPDVTLPENPPTQDEAESTIAAPERSEVNESTDTSKRGVSSQQKPSSPDSESPERYLGGGRNENHQDTPLGPNTVSSSLEVTTSVDDILLGRDRRNSRSLLAEDFTSDDLGASLEESLSLSFSSSPSSGREILADKSRRPYLHLSQWLSRGSPEGSTGDDVYLGTSDPEVEPELETYIDESPLVGLNPHVPWKYDAIAELLQPRAGETSDSSNSRPYGYETVRKLFSRDNSFSPAESVRESPTAPMNYENVLLWLERRRDEAGATRSKLPTRRKYSKALQWLRNEGRRD